MNEEVVEVERIGYMTSIERWKCIDCHRIELTSG